MGNHCVRSARYFKAKLLRYMHTVRTASALCGHCMRTACNADTMKPRGREGKPLAFMQASQGSLYPWWLVAVAKRNMLLRECVGKWWQPSGDIAICLDPLGANL